MYELGDFVGKVEALEQFIVTDDKKSYKVPVTRRCGLLRVISAQKGMESISDLLFYCSSDRPDSNASLNRAIGSWSVRFEKGERALVYLRYDSDCRCYKAVSWNAKTQI
jgi:hypothetical protein